MTPLQSSKSFVTCQYVVSNKYKHKTYLNMFQLQNIVLFTAEIGCFITKLQHQITSFQLPHRYVPIHI